MVTAGITEAGRDTDSRGGEQPVHVAGVTNDLKRSEFDPRVVLGLSCVHVCLFFTLVGFGRICMCGSYVMNDDVG